MVSTCWPPGAHVCASGPCIAACADAGRKARVRRATASLFIDLSTKVQADCWRSVHMRLRALAIAVCLLALPASAYAAGDPAQYVRPLSGTLGSGFPMVGASVPFGLIQPGPDTALPDGSDDPVNYCGYAFQDATIRGFSFTHFDGAGIKIAGDVPFMPTTGAPAFDAQANASPYEHATEVAEPG